MQMFIHTADGLTLEDVEAQAAAGDLAEKIAGAGAHVWEENADKPLVAKRSIGDQVADGAHVFIGTCKKITVTVRYGGDTKEATFAPAAAVQAVFAWATGHKGYDLTAAEAAKHALGTIDSQTIIERSDHIGAFATDCAVTLDLAPLDRFQG